MQVSKAADHRVESYKIENNSITIVTDPLPTEHGWREKRKFVGPLVKPSLCWLQRERDRQQYPTLEYLEPKPKAYINVPRWHRRRGLPKER
jgi:hypothetical protein